MKSQIIVISKRNGISMKLITMKYSSYRLRTACSFSFDLRSCRFSVTNVAKKSTLKWVRANTI